MRHQILEGIGLKSNVSYLGSQKIIIDLSFEFGQVSNLKSQISNLKKWKHIL